MTGQPAIDARGFVADDTARILDEWAAIARVPAPQGAEADRAVVIARLARACGADPVVDAVGNVVVTVDGDGEATMSFIATMDDLGTVAAHRAASDVLVVDGDRFVGPATETTSSDVSALAILRFLQAQPRPWPWRRVTLAWVLGEETGLSGMHALVAERGADLGDVVDLMGGVGTVSWNAIGFAGLMFEFTAQPRHSLQGGVSEVPDAMARFITALDDDPLPRHAPPWDADPLSTRRVNRLHAGDVFNHSPATGSVGVDIRSTDPAELERLDAATRDAAHSAATAAGVGVTIRDGERQPAMRLPGGRDHRLVQALVQAVRDVGHEPVLRAWSSSNVNVAYAAGLDGIVHDGTFRGEGRGTAEEWTHIPGVLAGIAADCRLIQLLTERPAGPA
ncbi:hypothetical protein [uncultured Jatrophihabitans sp.]|uniref:hypothetical protein n=1 Tax=uncultured Jatrophihabitans sp. TaxID=1610747 RepID=UPI0035CA9EC2